MLSDHHSVCVPADPDIENVADAVWFLLAESSSSPAVIPELARSSSVLFGLPLPDNRLKTNYSFKLLRYRRILLQTICFTIHPNKNKVFLYSKLKVTIHFRSRGANLGNCCTHGSLNKEM